MTARAALLALAVALAGPVAALAQPAEADPAAPAAALPAAQVGTLVVAHGASEGWNARVHAAAAAAATGGPVEVAFLMGPEAKARPFQNAVATLAEKGARLVVVVPLLVSSHSGHYEQIRWLVGATDSLSEGMRHHLHMGGLERPTADVPLVVAPALDDAEALALALADRARALAPEPAGRALFLVAHGPNAPEDHARWMEALRSVAERVRAGAGFADVKVGVLKDDAPAPVRAEAVLTIRETIALQARAFGAPVVAVPVLISAGDVSAVKVPADLADLPVEYGPEPLLPHPAISQWIVESSRAAAAQTTSIASP